MNTRKNLALTLVFVLIFAIMLPAHANKEPAPNTDFTITYEAMDDLTSALSSDATVIPERTITEYHLTDIERAVLNELFHNITRVSKSSQGNDERYAINYMDEAGIGYLHIIPKEPDPNRNFMITYEAMENLTSALSSDAIVLPENIILEYHLTDIKSTVLNDLFHNITRVEKMVQGNEGRYSINYMDEAGNECILDILNDGTITQHEYAEQTDTLIIKSGDQEEVIENFRAGSSMNDGLKKKTRMLVIAAMVLIFIIAVVCVVIFKKGRNKSDL